MDDVIPKLIFVALVLGNSWDCSECHSLIGENYRKYDNTSLARFRRQATRQSCQGENSKFQCATTADCIDIDLECDGKKDCPDGSDERETLCKSFPKKCRTPPQPVHGEWTYLHNYQVGPPSILVATGTVITFVCKENYKLSSTNENSHPVVCMPDGTWSTTVIPTCLRLCPKVYNSPILNVTCKTNGSMVPCDKATDFTVLVYKCAPFFERPYGRPENSICFEGEWDYTPKCITVCGEKRTSATPLVVNGHKVKRGHYPWVVALYSNKDLDIDYTNICGGSLISTTIVLTAAHCVTKTETGRLYPIRCFRVAAGKYYNEYGDERDSDTAQYSEIQEIILHDDYRGELQNFRADIAILKLKTNLELSKVVQPVCYNDLPALQSRDIGLVTGWGYTTTTGQPSDNLQELKLPYTDNTKCAAKLDPEFSDTYFISDKMCAGFYNQNTSVCKGDSGGGLVFKNPHYKNRYFIHGIVSLAPSYTENEQIHCNVQRSALFTRIGTYIEWIQLTVRRLNQNPCDDSKFQCAITGDCIDIHLECDGKEDCPDGSDERESLCKNFPCPGYLFRCEYGACISTDQKCNGVKNCNDNSDETNCPVVKRINTNCRSDQFECGNGQCIEIDNKCNGVAECEDETDETEELCLTILCSGYTFKCKYGACIDGDFKCDGIKQCLDHSDEDEKICGPKTPSAISAETGKKCRTPAQPVHGEWTYLHNHQVGQPSIQVASDTVIIFTCRENYKLSSTNERTHSIFCLPDGTWSITVIPTCLRLCPKVYNNSILTVTCKTDGSVVPCDKATDFTVLTHECAPYYEPPHGSPEKSTCFAGLWDFTPECIEVCGEKRVSATPLVVNGHEVERGRYPWVVALYSSKDSDPYYTNICGGSLISTSIVLTAAHCVTKKETGKLYPIRYFRVAAGKYYSQYGDERDNDTAQYSKVQEILLHKDYRGELQNFRGDIAILKLKTPLALSKVVQPVCYKNLPAIRSNDIGLVTGWGYTTTTGQPSEKLKELELPYIDDTQCAAELDSEFSDRYFTSDKMCAGFYNQNTSVCKGDSGGGLVFKNPHYKNRYFIHGIFSLAHSYTENEQIHCNVQRGALFTRVGTYIEWIQLTARRLNANKVEIG